MHSEFYQVDAQAAEKINQTKKEGGRIICVGTTSCRTIESAAEEDGTMTSLCGRKRGEPVNEVLLWDKLSCIHSREYTLFRFSAYGFPY